MTWNINERPNLPFDFEGLFFTDEQQIALKLSATGQIPLSADETLGVRDYISKLSLPPPAAANQADIETMLAEAVQARLDDTARSRGYSGMLSLCTYLASTYPKFATEAKAAIAWRDAVWSHCYQVLADCQAGTRPIPTAVELLAELPAIDW